ncbi:MAG: hypothetical protein ACO1N1_03315 [Dyadobacter fermentans]
MQTNHIIGNARRAAPPEERLEETGGNDYIYPSNITFNPLRCHAAVGMCARKAGLRAAQTNP